VSTLGDLAVAGRGETAGILSSFILPGGRDFSQSVSLGFDYKSNNQVVTPAGATNSTRTSYFYCPMSVTYSAAWIGQTNQTELNFGPTIGFRGLSSDAGDFAKTRYKADANFVCLRADLSHTHELPAGFQLYGKIQGQVADQPLVSGEQLGGGGLGTARGYLEGEVFGDDGIIGGLELRSPSLLGLVRSKAGDWRIYVFAEAGRLIVLEPLPEQVDQFDLVDFGIGSRFRLGDHFNGSLDLGIPLTGQTTTQAYNLHLTFRVWVEF